MASKKRLRKNVHELNEESDYQYYELGEHTKGPAIGAMIRADARFDGPPEKVALPVLEAVMDAGYVTTAVSVNKSKNKVRLFLRPVTDFFDFEDGKDDYETDMEAFADGLSVAIVNELEDRGVEL